MPAWLRTTLRLTLLVGLVSLGSIVGLIAFRNVIDIELLRASSDSIGTYMQTLGGIYAVLLGFVVIVVWGQFNDARGFVNREAASLVELYRIASGLPADASETIRRGLREYVDAVLTDEWPAMRNKPDEAVIERVGMLLEKVWVALHTCRPLDECGHTTYAEMLGRYQDLTELRTNRLTAATTKIPVAMNVLLYTGGLIMVVSVYLLPIDRFWLHATIAGGFAGAIGHILFLIWDLDDAFAGDYQIEKEPFLRARRAFDRTVDST